MKKIVFLVFAVTVLLCGVASAQGFEGGHLTITFTNHFDKVKEVSIIGKDMYFDDYRPNPVILHVKRRLSDGEGKAYTFLLLKDPTKLNLSRAVPNLIITKSGTIMLFYSDKTRQWEVFFADNEINIDYPLGCRVFTLS